MESDLWETVDMKRPELEVIESNGPVPLSRYLHILPERKVPRGSPGPKILDHDWTHANGLANLDQVSVVGSACYFGSVFPAADIK